MRSKQHRGLVHILLIEADDKIAAEIQPVLRSCAGKITSVCAGSAPADAVPIAPSCRLVVSAGLNPEARRAIEALPKGSGQCARVIVVLPPGLEAEAAPLLEALPCEVVVYDSAGKFLHLLRPLVRRALQEEEGAVWEATGNVGIMDQVRLLSQDRSVLISRYTPDTTLTYVNEVYCSFFQLPREALLGRSFLDLLPPDVGELVVENLSHLSPACPVHTAEYFVPMTELGPRWYEWTDIAVFDSCGEMVEIHGIGRDITPSKRAEQRYRALFDGLGDAALVADPSTGRILDVNAQAEIQFKRRRSELVGAPHAILLPPEKVTLGEALFRHHVREGGNLESKLEVMRGDGKVVPMVWRSTLIDNGLEPQLLGVFHDVSSQAVVEAALRESEERFREFVEGTDNLVVQIDPQGCLLYLNRAGERLFRSSSSACRGLRILDFMHPEDRAQTASYLDAWIRSKVSGGTLEGRMLGPGGAVRHILWTASLHYDDQMSLAYINAIGRDVTEWKRAEQELRASEHAMRRLYEITAARSRDGARTVQYLLAFGTVHFELESGLVLEHTSGGAEVLNSENLPAEWDARALDDLCGQLPFEAGEGRMDPVDFEVTDGAEEGAAGFQRLGVQAFLGTRLLIQDRPYGLLAFFSREPRRRPFSGRERELLKLMAQ
ncbi:MAG: PAS domain S-box protein, partial [Candidatus Hydrogenedentes bacterium]|nr:PAS domain S-box protein [Candidatus Hydrogenedentota bacterium]